MAKGTVILRLTNASLVMSEISAFAFNCELAHFLHSLLSAGGLEETSVQRLVHTLTGNWKLMVAFVVSEYVLA